MIILVEKAVKESNNNLDNIILFINVYCSLYKHILEYYNMTNLNNNNIFSNKMYLKLVKFYKEGIGKGYSTNTIKQALNLYLSYEYNSRNYN